MRVIYRDAVQAHAVPSSILEARGPFGRIEPQVVAQEYDPDAFPPGATAQNGMTEVVFYTCRRCQGTVREDYLNHHKCEE